MIRLLDLIGAASRPMTLTLDVFRILPMSLAIMFVSSVSKWSPARPLAPGRPLLTEVIP
jgi:hypothetical protein